MRLLSCLFALFLTHVAATPHIPPQFGLRRAESSPAPASPDHATLTACNRKAVLEKLTGAPESQNHDFHIYIADDDLTQQELSYILSDSGPLATELRGLRANEMLTAQCNVINAHKNAVRDCRRLDRLEKLSDLANNRTAYQEHVTGDILNKEQVQDLAQNISDAPKQLQEMRANASLVALCDAEPGLLSKDTSMVNKGAVASSESRGTTSHVFSNNNAADSSGASGLSFSRTCILGKMCPSSCGLILWSLVGLSLL